MKLGYKLVGAAIGIGLLISSTACVERPYTPVNVNDLGANKKNNIIIEGLPSLLRNDLTFTLKSNGEEFFVEPGHGLSIFVTGDKKEAFSALEKEVSDGDKETIKVLGNFVGNKTIRAAHLQVEGVSYPVYGQQ